MICDGTALLTVKFCKSYGGGGIVYVYSPSGLGHAVAQLVETLSYKSEVRGFDTGCCYNPSSLSQK